MTPVEARPAKSPSMWEVVVLAASILSAVISGSVHMVVDDLRTAQTSFDARLGRVEAILMSQKGGMLPP